MECGTHGLENNTYRVSVAKLEERTRWAGNVARRDWRTILTEFR